MKRLFVLLLAAIVSFPAVALEHARVVDGDTIRVDGAPVRVMGMDAPELRGRCPAEIAAARRAKQRMAELIAGGVTLRRHGWDRYRRLLAVVTDHMGRDVAVVMIREGLARPYGGQRRRSWCAARPVVRGAASSHSRRSDTPNLAMPSSPSQRPSAA